MYIGGEWFGIVNGQSWSVFDSGHTSVFSFLDNSLSKYQWIFTKLCMCIDIGELANGQISSVF